MKRLQRENWQWNWNHYHSRSVPATSLALIYVGLDERDQAFAWLEKAYEQRAFQLQWIKLEPRFDRLQSDRRFQDLMRRMGIPQ